MGIAPVSTKIDCRCKPSPTLTPVVYILTNAMLHEPIPPHYSTTDRIYRFVFPTEPSHRSHTSRPAALRAPGRPSPAKPTPLHNSASSFPYYRITREGKKIQAPSESESGPQTRPEGNHYPDDVAVKWSKSGKKNEASSLNDPGLIPHSSNAA